MSELVEQLEYALGEGPCIDVCHLNRPVLEPDLAASAAPRWLGFSGPAVDAGGPAIFGFPMRAGAVRLGALNLYRDQPGALTDDQLADALVMADLAAHALVRMRALAFAHDRPLDEVARDVVNRIIRFEPDREVSG